MPHPSRKPRLWLAACALLAAAACFTCLSRPAEGGCGPQPPQPVTGLPPVPPEGPPPAYGIPAPASAVAPAVPPTLEQLIDRLAAIKAQKEQLEKQEKALANEIRKKLAEQQQRLKKLGIEKDGPAPTPAQTLGVFFSHPF